MKNCRSITGILLIFVVALPPALLAQVQSTEGLKLVATGPLKLVFNDAALINHGQFSPGNSTVIFKGTSPATISGSKPINFHNLVIGQEVVLDNDLFVSGNLTMEQGNLQLNNRTLNLGYSGRIEGERNSARITGSNGGIIKAYAVLNAPAAANPGNLGIEISSASMLGETVIIRGHSAQLSSDGQPVIARYYDIQPRYNTNLRATLKLYYLDTELSNDKEEALTLFSSKNGQAVWTETGKDKSDLNSNWVVKNELDQLHRFTLAGATNKILANQNSKTAVQILPNPTPGLFTILLNSATGQEAALNLYDQLGRLLERKKVNFRAGVNNISWNIAQYANGTYYLSFENTDIKTIKIVKQ